MLWRHNDLAEAERFTVIFCFRLPIKVGYNQTWNTIAVNNKRIRAMEWNKERRA